MAGLGFGGSQGSDSGGGGRGGSRGMGIQFVKSSEGDRQSPSNGRDSSKDSTQFVKSSGGDRPSPSNGRDSSKDSTQPKFGAPAQLFGSGGGRGATGSVSSSSSFGRPTSGSPSLSFGKIATGSASSSFGKGASGSPSSSSFGFVRAGETGTGSGRGGRLDYRMPGSVDLARGARSQPLPRTPAAKPVLSAQEYQTAWRRETDEDLKKLRKLAWEVVSLKSNRPNAIDKLHSAANRVPTRVEFNTEPVVAGRGNNSFMCYVFVEGISVGRGQGLKLKDAKLNAYEAALQTILMPHLRVVPLDPESRRLDGSEQPFTSPPPKPASVPLRKSLAEMPPSAGGSKKPSGSDVKTLASQHKESNLEAASVKRRLDEQRPLEDFVIVEPLVPIPDCTPAHTMRRSADFNHMLLEYEFFFQGEAARCIMRVEGQVLADVNAGSKLAAKNRAAEQGLRKLKQICWVIKTKQAVDSDTKISKDEMLSELDQSDAITEDNVGNKMLRKMGWSGGGVGKDGSGIAEPVSLKSVLNREGLGLGTAKGITDEYKRRVKEVIENYAASGNQEDLVFNCDFHLDERLIIHDECRRLNLRSKCKGKGANRYLCVRRKRSANMLFDHIMSCGGETVRYKLVPPGNDTRDSYLPRGSGSGARNSPSSFQGGGGGSHNLYDSPSQGNRDRGRPGDMGDRKWAFGPPPSSLMTMSANRSPQHGDYGRYGTLYSNGSQDIRNSQNGSSSCYPRGSDCKVKSEFGDGDRGGKSCGPSGDSRGFQNSPQMMGSSAVHNQIIKSEPGVAEQGPFVKSEPGVSSATDSPGRIGVCSNDVKSMNNQGMMGQNGSQGQVFHNPNNMPMTNFQGARFQNHAMMGSGGMQNSMTGPGRVQNPMMGPAGMQNRMMGAGFGGGCGLPNPMMNSVAMNIQGFGMQGLPNLNPRMKSGGQWMGNANSNVPNFQQQQQQQFGAGWRGAGPRQ